MKFYLRTGRGTGVSVGIVGTLLLAGVGCAMRGLWQQLRRRRLSTGAPRCRL